MRCQVIKIALFNNGICKFSIQKLSGCRKRIFLNCWSWHSEIFNMKFFKGYHDRKLIDIRRTFSRFHFKFCIKIALFNSTWKYRQSKEYEEHSTDTLFHSFLLSTISIFIDRWILEYNGFIIFIIIINFLIEFCSPYFKWNTRPHSKSQQING